MYSKLLLDKYIDARLKQKDWAMSDLAKALGIPHSNLLRAINSEQHNLTLNQFAQVVELLELTPEQVYHILIGKKAKEATTQLVNGAAKKLVESFLKDG